MSASGDILERLWLEVINPDPAGGWMKNFISQPRADEHPIREAKSVVDRVLQTEISPVDAGQLVRPVRYEMCFGILYALDDPGLKKGDLKGLHQLLVKHNPEKPASRAREKEFFQVLWEGIRGNTDFDSWVSAVSKQKLFKDAIAAAQRLLQHGVTKDELVVLLAWDAYETCYNTLRLLGECFGDAEEALGLHESLLGADPSGLEGGPGSWPGPGVAENKTTAPVHQQSTKPYLTIKGAQGFTFLPQNRGIATWGTGGAVRICDLLTGAETTCLQEAKNFETLAFSPDGQSLVAMLRKRLVVVDIKNGRKKAEVPWKFPSDFPCWISWERDGIFAISAQNTGRVSNHYSFFLLQPETLAPLRQLSFPGAGDLLRGMAFSPDGRKLALGWYGGCDTCRLTIWSWPDAEKLGEWTANSDEWKWSPDGNVIGVESSSMSLRQALTGELLRETRQECGHLAFSPDGQWLAAGTHSEGEVTIWNLPRWQQVNHFTIDAGYCFHLEFSPDGRVLGATTHRRCLFWDFPALLPRT